MEVGEKVKSFLGRKSEEQDLGGLRLLDVKSKKNPVLSHSTSSSRIDGILNEGLISRGAHDPNIWFKVGPVVMLDFAVLVPSNQSVFDREGRPVENVQAFWTRDVVVHHRIAPREFAGFLVKKNEILEEIVHTLQNSMNKRGGTLPIYDENGDLVWPTRISHREIVRTIEKRQK